MNLIIYNRSSIVQKFYLGFYIVNERVLFIGMYITSWQNSRFVSANFVD